MPEEPAVRVGVSACLLGEAVRFDGGHKHDRFLTDRLGPHVRWVSVCPELELGLGAPRESLRLVGDATAPRLVAPRSGTDHTAGMQQLVDARVDALADAGLDGFVLKKASPTCGMERVRVYPDVDGGAPSRDGVGVFARALQERLPLLPVEEEGRLHDDGLRESFLTRVFAHHRWRRFLDDAPAPGDLVAFHSAHKYTLLAHDEQVFRRLGRLVAQAGTLPFERLLTEYGTGFMTAQRTHASRGKHANVLTHLAGFFKDELDGDDRAELADTIERYRTGLVPLVVPLTLLRHHLRHHPHPWVARQTYLEPYPAPLQRWAA